MELGKAHRVWGQDLALDVHGSPPPSVGFSFSLLWKLLSSCILSSGISAEGLRGWDWVL